MLPKAFIKSLVGLPGFEEASFIAVHENAAQITSLRLNEAKPLNNEQHPFLHNTSNIPWCPQGRYLAERPLFVKDPLWHAGAYYVQEASSMMLHFILSKIIPTPKNEIVLDLCAAPGGKTSLLLNYFKEGLVIANETIKSRNAILVENCIKWGSDKVVVTQNDPAHFKQLPGFFDVLLVDAPCSGSGLFRKDPAAIAEWSEEHVQHCSMRQIRIIDDSIACLKEGGYLIYATCSYSKEEDEQMMDHIATIPGMKNLTISMPTDWNIIDTFSEKQNAKGFRAYPNKIKGEGFFITVFQKQIAACGFSNTTNADQLIALTKQEAAVLNSHITLHSNYFYCTHQKRQLAIPLQFINEIKLLLSHLYIKQLGMFLGEIKGKDLVPSHALALSNWNNLPFDSINLNLEMALQFLRRTPLVLEGNKGWHTITYLGIRLGWVKILPNRCNNYYPNDWRILNY